MNKSLNKRYGMAFIEPCTIFATAISKYLEEFRARLVVLEAYSDLRETIRQGSLNPSCCALLLNDDCLQDENAQAYLKALRDSNPKLQILALISQNTSLLESFIKAKLIDKWFDKGVSFDSLVVSILSYLDKIPTICTYKKPDDNITLTPEQEVVFQLLSQGQPLKCIANECNVSLSSIEKMLRAMRVAHGANSNPQLIKNIIKKRQRGKFD